MESMSDLADGYHVVSTPPKEGSLLHCLTQSKLASKLHTDPTSIKKASTDFGNMVHLQPSAVLHPSSAEDIRRLIELSNNCSSPFVISVRGNGHSTRGQAMAANGVVIDMEEMRKSRNKLGVSIAEDLSYADVGGEMLWRDVMKETFAKGVLPVSWVDFLGLTVGGTLSNAGINGGTFRTGPLISSVLEMDVVTGKGKMVTCSPSKDSDLFYCVLGGLGQFGVITRARIPLQPAKQWARWVRVFYTDFDVFKKDEESLVAINDKDTVGFVQGHVIMDNNTGNEWTNSFIPSKEHPHIHSLVKKHSIIYSIEFVEPYNDSTKVAAMEKVERTLKGLNSIDGMVYEIDVPYPAFLDRIKIPAHESESHPWLDIFVPQSRISEFHSGVVKNLLVPRKNAFGPVLMYPANKSKWDSRMATPTPDEDVFYIISFLLMCKESNWKQYRIQINEILEICNAASIQFKTYLHRYATTEEWKGHFGCKWATMEKMKEIYDPKHILSPEQKIFDN